MLFRSLRIPESFNVVLFEARFSGENNHENKDESYSLDFKNTPTLNRSTLRHINNFPDRRKDLGAKASYTHVLGRKLSLYFDYMFSYSDKNANSMLYHSSKDNDDTDKSPSYYNLSTMILDIDNSYKQKSINFTHSISPGFTGTIGNCWFQLSFPIIILIAYGKIASRNGEIAIPIVCSRICNAFAAPNKIAAPNIPNGV